jgi:hypothetical protein
VNVGPGETRAPTIQIYRPSTIDVVLRDSGGSLFSGDAQVRVTSARDGKTQTFTVSGGTAAVTAVSGEQILPNVQYTVEAWTTSGTPLCTTPQTQYVPDDYPTDLTSTFTLTFGNCPSGDIAVHVTWGGSVPAAGATVTLSGGPYALSPVSGTTDSAGDVTFLNVPAGNGYTVVASKYGQTATDSAVNVNTGQTTNVTLDLPAGSLVVQVRWAGLAVDGATVTVTGGPDSVNLTGTTPSSGNLTFVDLAPGNGYTVTATKSGQSATLTNVTVTGGTTTVTLNLPTATLTVNVKRSGTNQSSATVILSLGPMGLSPVNRTTNSSGNATFTNVPVGTGYTIKAYKCSVSSPRAVTVTNQTVNAPSTTINVSFNSGTCPPP